MPASSRPPFSLLIKPAGADCNLRCAYCFYLEKASLYPGSAHPRMSDAVLERLIASYMATDQPQYLFGWQGGEPTLMGLPFFQRAIALQRRYGRPGAVVANGLQTNGTLLDAPLAAFLAEHRFLVGVSLDGPAALHDPNRATAGGGPTHARVLAGIDTLGRNRVEFNILTLVNRLNGNHPETIYRDLVARGFRYHQYIPCVEFDAQGRLLPVSVSARQWGDFLCALFDRWYAADTRTVSIRLFDSLLVRLVDGVANVCAMGRTCCQYFLVEHNGDVYPCDFFAEPGLKLGNILDQDWDDLLDAPVYRAFGDRKARWNSACAACPWLAFCAGDCPKHRLAGGSDPTRLSALCEGWKQFYAHTLPRFQVLADAIRRDRRNQAAVFENAVRAATPRPQPRNAPCPCGSGRKYKHCCGAT